MSLNRKELEYFQSIAEAQYPKVMNILELMLLIVLDTIGSVSYFLSLLQVVVNKIGRYVKLTYPRTVYGDCLCRL